MLQKLFMSSIVEVNSIPGVDDFQSDCEGERLMKLMEENRKANINRPEMSLEKINAEIAAAKSERKK